jgi:hypothetical protein
LKTLFQLNLSNYRLFNLVGKRLIWERGWAKVYNIDPEEEWADNIGIAGMSVRSLLEEFDEVYLVTEI